MRDNATRLLLALCLLGAPIVAVADDHTTSQPPPAPAAPSVNLTQCQEILNGTRAHVQKELDETIKINVYNGAPWYVFRFRKDQGRRHFYYDVCSEFFNFMVTEGFFPFHEDWAVDECTQDFLNQVTAGGYGSCPNMPAIRQAVRNACNDIMRDKIRKINARSEEILAAYRKCPRSTDPMWQWSEDWWTRPYPGRPSTGDSNPLPGDGQSARSAAPGAPPMVPRAVDAVPKTPCKELAQDISQLVTQVVENQVGLVDLGEWEPEESRYVINWLGTSGFSPCSEFFNFLVEEGAFPFDENKAVEECVTLFLQWARNTAGGTDCPEWGAIEQQVRTTCEATMRPRVRAINARREELIAIQRKCQERDVAEYERRTRIRDWLRDGGGLPPTKDAVPAPPQDTTPAPPPKDTASAPEGTVPPEPPPHTPPDTTPRPPKDTAARPAASCCEKCPATAFDRFYVPITPNTECEHGDVRRDDLSVDAGTCANPLPIDPQHLGPETNGETCCGQGKDQLLYQHADKGETTTDAGAAVRTPCPSDVPPPCGHGQQQTLLETSLMTTGKGSDYRHWEPEKPVLQLGQQQLKPCRQEPFYVPKESATNVTMVAVAIFTAIDHEYEDDAPRAAEHPGTPCASGAAHPAPRSRTARAIDQAGKAAALGLLTSQAKGEIKGLRATFDVTGREQQLDTAKLHVRARQHITQEYTDVTMPLPLQAPEANTTTGAQ